MIKKTNKKQSELFGLEKVTEFLKIIFNSGKLKGVKPLSVIMTAPVSNGKTTSVLQFTNNPAVKILGDCTAYGVLKAFTKELETQEVRHIIIPDLLNVLVRRKSTVEQLIMFINASSEEGLSPSSTYGIEIRHKIPPFGWVLCVTREGYKKKKSFFDTVGFSSRFLRIDYNYDMATINKIVDNIINEKDVDIPDIKLKNKGFKRIHSNIKLFKDLHFITRFLCPDNKAERIRLQRNFQTFLKAAAYTRGSDKVEEADLNKLKDLVELIKPIGPDHE